MGTYYKAQEAQLGALWWPRWVGWEGGREVQEGGPRERGYMYTYSWFDSLYSGNWNSIIKQLYPNKKKGKKYIYIKHEFILISPTLIHHHIDNSILFLCLICKLTWQQWEIWLPPSAIHLLNCLFLIAIYSSFWIVNLYSLVREHYQPEYTAYVKFLMMKFTDSIHSQIYLAQYLLSSSSSVNLLYTSPQSTFFPRVP